MVGAAGRRALDAAAAQRRARDAPRPRSRGCRASARARTPRSRSRSPATILDAGDEPGAAALYRRAARARRRRAGATRAERFALGLAAAGVIRARMRGDLADAPSRTPSGSSPPTPAATCARWRCSTSASRGSGPARWRPPRATSSPPAARPSRRGRDWLALVAVASLAAHAVVTGRLERGAPAGRRGARARGRARLGPDAGRSGSPRRRSAASRSSATGATTRSRHFRRADELLTHAPDVPLRMAMMMQRRPARGRRGPAGAGARGARARGRAERGLAGDARDARARRRAGGDQPRRARRPRGRRGAAAQRRRLGAATAEQAAALARLRLLAGDPAGARAALAPWLDGAADAYGPTAVELWLLEALAHDAEARARAGRRGARARARRGRAARRPAPVRRARRAASRRCCGASSARAPGTGRWSRTLLHELARPPRDARPRVAARRAALRPRGGGPALPAHHDVQRRDRRGALRVHQHRQDPPEVDLPQARRPDRREAVRRARELGLLAP